MSQMYQMDVFLKKVKASKVGDVTRAAGEEWDFSGWSHDNPDGQEDRLIDLSSGGTGSLAGGETPDEFADRLALAVWRANGGFCEVEVYAICMEDLPQDEHKRGLREFKRLTKRPRVK